MARAKNRARAVQWSNGDGGARQRHLTKTDVATQWSAISDRPSRAARDLPLTTNYRRPPTLLRLLASSLHCLSRLYPRSLQAVFCHRNHKGNTVDDLSGCQSGYIINKYLISRSCDWFVIFARKSLMLQIACSSQRLYCDLVDLSLSNVCYSEIQLRAATFAVVLTTWRLPLGQLQSMTPSRYLGGLQLVMQ